MLDRLDSPSDLDGDATFLARVATPLRRAERLAPDFEARLMRAVAADAPVAPATAPRAPGSRAVKAPPAAGWWRRPRELRISPLAGLAVAAGFAGIVCLTTLRLAAHGPGSVPVEAGSPVVSTDAGAPSDRIHVVRFALVAPNARRVALIGDFNGWADGATPLVAKGRGGVWMASVALPAGRHEYAFLLDGVRWLPDPNATPVRDDYDTESSIVTVGPAAASRS